VADLKRRLSELLLRWQLAYGGIIMAVEGMREMDEACRNQQA